LKHQVSFTHQEKKRKKKIFVLAKIYAARIDSLYSETRKAQSILRSTNENMNRIIDDEDDIDGGGGDNEDDFSERRISNNKKIRLLMKRKKSIVTDRNKLLRKNRNDEFRPIMINQFFLSAMNNDNIMLSELYDKMNISLTIDDRKKIIKTDQNDVLSSSLNSNDFVCDSLYIDTTNSSIISSMLTLLDKGFLPILINYGIYIFFILITPQ
jgi:hypothetical protein